MPQYTLEVTIKLKRSMRIRLWIAARLIWLAALLMNCKLELIIPKEAQDESKHENV